MADPTVTDNLVKKTTAYDPDSGTDKPLKKKKKKNPAYAPRKSKRAKAYKAMLDEAGNY